MTPTETTATHPPVRTFHPRRSRTTPRQQRAVEQLLPLLAPVAGGDGRWDLTATFGGRPVVLEIGPGMGESTLALAARQPGVGVVAVDVHTPGIGRLAAEVEAAGLDNVRLVLGDALTLVAGQLPPACLAGVRVFFPDPWPKARHHKRRLVRPDVVALLTSRLQPGGTLHCATDWEPYAEQMLAVLAAEPGLRNRHAGFAPRPAWRPVTRFEARGLREGRVVRDVEFERR